MTDRGTETRLSGVVLTARQEQIRCPLLGPFQQQLDPQLEVVRTRQ